MRPDFGKVITERPRGSSRAVLPRKGYRKRLRREGIDRVRHEPMSKLGNDEKDFTDVLGPIRGFLRSRCGRRWDDVLSEIAKALPATGGVSYRHARDHLFDMVELGTRLIDGELCDSKGYPVRRYIDFYVCPKGFLREFKRKRSRYQHPKPPEYKRTPAGEWLIEQDGIWFACEMAGYEANGYKTVVFDSGNCRISWPAATYPVVYDVLLRQTIGSPQALGNFYQQLNYYPRKGGRDGVKTVYCYRKRALGKAEIRRYGLRK